MLIGMPFSLFVTSSLTPPGKTTGRTVCSNGNFLPYTYNNATGRFSNYDKLRTVATNANWSLPIFEWGNWSDNNTSESIGYPTVVVKGAMIHNGTRYSMTFGGASEIVCVAGASVACDPIPAVTINGGSKIRMRLRLAYPLLFDAQTGNFTVGQVVTGATSGATGVIHSQTDAGTTGSLVLLSETGTFVDNEIITDPLGGSATVNLASNYAKLATVGTHAAFAEGGITSNNSAIDYTVADPAVLPVYTATVNGSGQVTGVNMVSPGSGFTAGPNMFIRETMADGTLQIVQAGYGNLSGGTITSGTLFSNPSSAPAGYVWTNPIVSFSGNGSFGATTQITDWALMSAIPDRAVASLRLNGDSIGRGYSSTDGNGDENRNFGIWERAIANRFGVINMSTAGGALGNQAQFATTFARQYGFYNGRCTHGLITLGSNDATAGATKAAMQSQFNSIANHMRVSGEKVSGATLIPRAKSRAITGITQAANAVVTVANDYVGGEVIVFSSGVGGMTQIRNLTATVVSATATTATVNIDSSGFSAYTSGGTIQTKTPSGQSPETGFTLGGVADTYNSDLLGGSVTVDWAVVNVRPTFQDATVTTAWKDTPDGLTGDWIHPSGVGLGFGGTDAAFKAYFNTLA
jgi:hypothetical protein